MDNERPVILVVDDEENIRLTFRTFLEDEGYSVVTTENYRDALQAVTGTPVDVILSDIIMEDKTGIDLLRELKNRGLRSPVIMITGAPNIETATESVRLGAFDYIPKPFNKQTLLKVVSHALRHKALDDERDSKQRHLEALFKSVQDAIVTVSPLLTITQANEAASRLFDLPLSAIIGQRAAAVISPALQPVLELLEKTMLDRQPLLDFSFEWVRDDKRTAVCVFNSWPLMDSGGLCIGVVLTVRDVSRLSLLERELKERGAFHRLVGKSSVMQDVYELIEKLSEIETTVLITGPSGTGKELVAEAIHYNGCRALKPLVKVNCSALAENLLESELFGHVAGAFTGATKDRIGRFQMADGGTLFLDEIGDIPLALQLKLLRVLQEKRFERVGDTRSIDVDVRIISATNAHLAEKIEAGTFREDLYYRLNVMEIELPPLSCRTEDIPLLVECFREKYNAKMKKNIKMVSDQVLGRFMENTWPGNVRELEHVMERAFVLCHQDMITMEHIPRRIRDAAAKHELSPGNDQALLGECEIFIDTLQKVQWNRTRAAEMLGISRQTLYRKMKRYNLLG
ncbi:MAG: response regulator [Deltaproteobacteria bacterium]|nr:response regulator [Deltaproteobacteria bacterium]